MTKIWSCCGVVLNVIIQLRIKVFQDFLRSCFAETPIRRGNKKLTATVYIDKNSNFPRG